MIVAPELAVFDRPPTSPDRVKVVLVSADDAERDRLAALFDPRRYAVVECRSAEDALTMAATRRIALIVAVCDRPDSDALSLCWKARDADAPVVLLARQGADAKDRVFALEAGADDLLPCPPEPREFAAVIAARSRRSAAPLATPASGIRRDRWILNSDTRSVLNTEGARAILSRSEWALLQLFAERKGQIIEAQDAVSTLDLKVSDASIGFRMAVSRLRRKLGEIGAGGLIRCVRGEGYMLDGPTQLQTRAADRLG